MILSINGNLTNRKNVNHHITNDNIIFLSPKGSRFDWEETNDPVSG
jgi:hypothetical protein